MPVSIGPLGNQQVRVEDSVTVQSASADGAGTVAVNTVTVDISAGLIPAGSYWRFNGPDAPADKPGVPVLKYHVWYEVTTTAGGTLGVDPLPKETNQVGIKVIVASGTAIADVAAATGSTIEAYFAGPNLVTASATVNTNDVVVTNLTVGPALCEDGIGARASGLPASTTAATGFVFASNTPGVAADTRTFEVASAAQATDATGASILSLVARHTGSTFSVGNDSEVTTITMPASSADWSASAGGDGAHFMVRTFGSTYYLWYSLAGAATDPSASGTGLEISGLGSAAGAVELASQTASVVNDFTFGSTSFTASATAGVLTLTHDQPGQIEEFPTSNAAASDVDASVAIATPNSGGTDWSIDFSNRFSSPAVDLETDNS